MTLDDNSGPHSQALKILTLIFALKKLNSPFQQCQYFPKERWKWSYDMLGKVSTCFNLTTTTKKKNTATTTTIWLEVQHKRKVRIE